MGDFDNPVILARDYWALTKLWHAVDALYMWEFFTTLDYEWSVIRGRRPYRWTIWIYSLTRMATLMAAILNLIGLDAATPINCQTWVLFNFIFAYIALACSSLLIVFRVIAIWNKNKVVVAIAVSVWGTDVSCLSEGIARIRSGWDSKQDICVVLNISSNKLTMIAVLVTDVILLLTMFVGLLRMHTVGAGTFELERLLWKQGVIWFLLGTVAELVPVVFIGVYLNDALNIMFLMPSLLAMSIASTRMYRSLADFVTADIVKRSDRTAMGTKRSYTVFPQPDQMELNVYTSDHYPHQGRDISYINTGKPLPDQPRGPSLDDDLETNGLMANPLFRNHTY